jgi:hypothetical protein
MKVVVKLLIALALSAAFAGCSGLPSYDDSSSPTERRE